jgi:CSLREA domain-containing protein
MRRSLLVALALAAVLATSLAVPLPRPTSADGPSLTVTSLADSGPAVCPSVDDCTLRKAIETANADAEPGTFTITFSSDVFVDSSELVVGTVPLPAVTRSDVTISGTGAQVSISSSSLSLTTSINGLTSVAAGFVLQHIRIHGFTGDCLVSTGDSALIGGPAAGDGNFFGGCRSGIVAGGNKATIQGNLVGFTPDGAADPVQSGVVVAGANALIGGPPTAPDATNRIGFADAAVVVGTGGAAFSGTHIQRNIMGRRPTGEPAPVGKGIVLAQPSSLARVETNVIANANVGIELEPYAGAVSVSRNSLLGNTFEALSGLAIDLNADDVHNPNDDGDTDTGPNTMLNAPVISRATQTRITGTACASCKVQLYLAHHQPGGQLDYGTAMVGETTSAAGGEFAIDGPAATAGDWVLATATDSDGNTSEFGEAARVGTGAILCGNVQLSAGWNHVGYFGAEPVALLSTFPPDPQGLVTAVYRFEDGTGDFEHWFSSTPVGRTLTTIQPGESYWFFATAPVTLPGGFSISFPLPVQLKAGWNDLVYLGASADVSDALAELPAGFEDLYRFDPVGGRWLRYGDASVPSWAREFNTLDACSTYQIKLSAPATLTPLQP